MAESGQQPVGGQQEENSASKGMYSVFSEAIKRVRDERLILLIVYLTLVGAVVASSVTIGGTWGAVLLLTALLLATLVTVHLLRKQSATGITTRFGQNALKNKLVGMAVVAVPFIAILFAHSQALFAPLLPGIYPLQAGKLVVSNYYIALSKIFNSQNENELKEGYLLFLSSFTREKANRFFSKHAQSAGLPCPSDPAEIESYRGKMTDADLTKVAKRFRDLYPGISSLTIELITKQSTALKNDRQMYLAALRYEGRFLVDGYFEEVPFSQLIETLQSPDSASRKAFNNRLRYYYPNIDLTTFWQRLPSQKLNKVQLRNAFEMLAYETKCFGSIDQEKLLIGSEVTVESVALQKLPSTGSFFSDATRNPWKILEIGIFGRQRTTSATLPANSEVTEDSWVKLPGSINYTAQQDPSWCQSAALETLASYTGQENDQSQDQIRAELEAKPKGAENHDSRLSWARDHLKDVQWDLAYITSSDKSYEELRRQINSGIPVVMSTRFTRSGHVVVITGVGRDSAGRFQVEAYDPAGYFDFPTHSFESEHSQPVKYYLDHLVVKTRAWKKGNDTKLAFYITGSEEWYPPVEELLKKGYHPDNSAKSDWEFLRGAPLKAK